MVSQGYSKSEYEHCLYFKRLNDKLTIIVLYVDDIIIVSKRTGNINRLKAHMARTFDMKDLGAAKLILVIEIHSERKMVSSVFHRRSMLRKYLKDSK